MNRNNAIKNLKKKQAFTLAGVLITLGIIGVVAAMTIPNLMQKNFERRTVVQLRKTQSIIAQAMKMAEEEYGDVEGWDLTSYSAESNIKIAQYLKPFLKIAVDCGTETADASKCMTTDNYKRKNGDVHPIDYTAPFYKIILNNGSCIFFNTDSALKDYIITFYIDTNGKYPPNTIGKDLFMFEYGNNSLRPFGAWDSAFPYDTYCKPKNSIGLGCAYYVLTQQNMNYLH